MQIEKSKFYTEVNTKADENAKKFHSLLNFMSAAEDDAFFEGYRRGAFDYAANEVFILRMVCRTYNDPSTDEVELNAVFRKEEDAKKMGEDFMKSEGIGNKKYVSYKIDNFYVL